MRRIVILERAAEDMERAREFYDAQESGNGDYLNYFTSNSRTSTASIPASRIACIPKSVSS